MRKTCKDEHIITLAIYHRITGVSHIPSSEMETRLHAYC